MLDPTPRRTEPVSIHIAWIAVVGFLFPPMHCLIEKWLGRRQRLPAWLACSMARLANERSVPCNASSLVFFQL